MKKILFVLLAVGVMFSMSAIAGTKAVGNVTHDSLDSVTIKGKTVIVGMSVDKVIETLGKPAATTSEPIYSKYGRPKTVISLIYLPHYSIDVVDGMVIEIVNIESIK